MKNFITIIIALVATISVYGQSGYRYVQNSYGYNNYRYYDDYNNNYDNRYRRTNYSRWYNYLSNRDFKRLRKLERRLDSRIKCALEDGYVSRRDQRRINEVERDIDELLSRYDFYRGRNGRDGRRGNRSGLNRICR